MAAICLPSTFDGAKIDKTTDASKGKTINQRMIFPKSIGGDSLMFNYHSTFTTLLFRCLKASLFVSLKQSGCSLNKVAGVTTLYYLCSRI